MQTRALWAIILLAMLVQAACAEKVLSINLDVYQNDSVKENSVKIEEGNPNVYVSPGDYLLEVLRADGSVAASQYIGLKFLIYSDPPTPVNYSTINLRIRYSGDMKKIRLFNKDKLIYSADIAVCVVDGVCGPHETHISCPQDCTLDKSDGICTPAKDGVCDPDCGSGVDPDCRTPSTLETCDHNGLCEPHLGENAQNCVDDCGSPDQKCRTVGQAIKNAGGQRCCSGLAPLECSTLGADGKCAATACDVSMCEPCGDGSCSGPENKCNCPADCAPVSSTVASPATTQTTASKCGNGVCEGAAGETAANCPQDCVKAANGSFTNSPYFILFALIIIIIMAYVFYRKLKGSK